MTTIREDSVQFRNNDGTSSNPATMFVTEYTQSDALKRALLRLGLFWLLALGSVPIIIAHWVLVPGFFIAGPVVAVMVYRTRESKDRAEGVCPSCNESVTVKLETKDTIPKWTYCPSCSNSLHIDNI